jgi:hypothetical protein
LEGYTLYHDYGKQFRKISLTEDFHVSYEPETSVAGNYKFLTRNTATGRVESLAVTSLFTNIYNADGELEDDREVEVGEHDLNFTFEGVSLLRLNKNLFGVATENTAGDSILTRVVVADGDEADISFYNSHLFFSDEVVSDYNAGDFDLLVRNRATSYLEKVASSSIIPSFPDQQVVYGTGTGMGSSSSFIYDGTSVTIPNLKITTVSTATGVDAILVYDGTEVKQTSFDDLLSAGGAPTGSGLDGRVARWSPDANTLTYGVIQDNGTNVGIGVAPSASWILYASGDIRFGGTSSGIKTAAYDANHYGLYHSSIATPGITNYGLLQSATQTFVNGTSGVHLMISNNSALSIFSDRNIGISTSTNAGYKVDINGTLRVQNISYFGSGLASGNVVAEFINTGTTKLKVLLGTSAAQLQNSSGLGGVQINNTANGFLQIDVGRIITPAGWPIISSSGNLLLRGNTSGTAGNGVIIQSFHSGDWQPALTILNGSSTALFSGGVTASSAIARGVYVNNTLVAAANNDVLVGIDVSPTFTIGAFTGVNRFTARLGSNLSAVNTEVAFGNISSNAILSSGASFYINLDATNTYSDATVFRIQKNAYGTTGTGLFEVAEGGTVSTLGSVTAASAIARGLYVNNTLVAAANNDVLVGLDINPTFTNGAFTGVLNIGARVRYADATAYTSTSASRYIPAGANMHITNSATGLSNAYSGLVFNTLNSAGTTGGIAYMGLSNENNFGGSFVIGMRTGTTSYSEYLRIFSDGNVGINTTTNAGYKLDVNGTGRFTGNLYTTHASSARMYVQETGGNIGEVAQLHLQGNSGTWGSSIRHYVGSGGATQELRLYANATLSLTLSPTAATFTGTISATSLTATGLTAGRIPYVGTGGLLSNSSKLQWIEDAANPTIKTIAGTNSGAINMYDEAGTTNYLGLIKRPSSVGGSMGLPAGSAEILFNGATTSALGIFTYSASYLAFGTSNTERGRITPAGNWLIGTTTDAGQKLQVNGTTLITPSTNASFSIASQGLTTITTNGGGGALAFQIVNFGGNTLMQVTENGYTRLRIVTHLDSYATIIFYGRKGGTSGYDFHFSGLSTYAFASTTNGMLNVAPTIQSQTAAIWSGIRIAPTYNLNANTTSASIMRGLFYDPTIANLQLATHIAIETVSGNNYFGTTSGSVGIGLASGTSFASYKMVIKGGTVPQLLALYGDTTNNIGYIDFYNNNGSTQYGRLYTNGGTGEGGFVNYHSSGYIVLATSLGESLRIFNDKNVAIGTTTNAGYKFQVNGTSLFSGAMTVTGALYIDFISGRTVGTPFILRGNGTNNVSGDGIYIDEGASYSGSGVSINHVNIATTGTGVAVSGVSTYNHLKLSPTYNSISASAGSFIRGLYYSPTITSIGSATHIAIETVSGNNYFGTTSGSVGIGLASGATLSYKVNVKGDFYMEDSTSTYKTLWDGYSWYSNEFVCRDATSGITGNARAYVGGSSTEGQIYVADTVTDDTLYLHPTEIRYSKTGITARLQWVPTANRTVVIPDASGTVMLENAISGTFTTVDGKTITVTNGRVTNIV